MRDDCWNRTGRFKKLTVRPKISPISLEKVNASFDFSFMATYITGSIISYRMLLLVLTLVISPLLLGGKRC